MRRRTAVFLCVLMVLTGASLAEGAILYQNLGTSAPPTSIGVFTLAPFDTAPQAAITDGTSVTTIPGSPVPGSLTCSPALTKATVGVSWATWSNGYTGPVFSSSGGLTNTLTLPTGVGAFYFYAEPSSFAQYSITATSDSGTTSGPVLVDGNAGATGFAFYATSGESIATITITAASGAGGFAIGEFGAAGAIQKAIPALSGWGITASILALLAVGLFVLRGRQALG